MAVRRELLVISICLGLFRSQTLRQPLRVWPIWAVFVFIKVYMRECEYNISHDLLADLPDSGPSNIFVFNHHAHHYWWYLPVSRKKSRVHALWIKCPITVPFYFSKRQNKHQIKTDQQSIRICKNPLRDLSMSHECWSFLCRENEYGRISMASTFCLNPPSDSGLSANQGVAVCSE